MPRRISSLLTFLLKVSVPVGIVLGVLIFIYPERNAGAGVIVVMSVFIALVAAYGIWLHWPIKQVRVDDDNRYVSNYKSEIVVPLGEIENVTEFILSEPRRVTIHLRNDTEFGRKIVFLAPYRAFAFLSPHPIVDELIQMSVRKTLQ